MWEASAISGGITLSCCSLVSRHTAWEVSKFVTQFGVGALALESWQFDLGMFAHRLDQGHVPPHDSFSKVWSHMCFGYFHLVLGINSIQSLVLLCWGLVVFFASWSSRLVSWCWPGLVNHWSAGRLLNLQVFFKNLSRMYFIFVI